MQMTPGGMGQGSRVAFNPEQVVQALAPIVTEAQKIHDSGATVQSMLREAVLAAFLSGRGLTPAQAMDTVMQWRMARVAPSLTREMRTPAEATTEAPTAKQEDRQELAALIQKFMQDQANANVFYGELVDQLAGKPELQEYVRHAQQDEQKHYRMLGGLYQELTGKTYDVQPKKTEYASLPAGLKLAMDDEYAAMEEYRDVYLKYDSRRIRELFFELMTDELEHATRFNYVLQVLGD